MTQFVFKIVYMSMVVLDLYKFCIHVIIFWLGRSNQVDFCRRLIHSVTSLYTNIQKLMINVRVWEHHFHEVREVVSNRKWKMCSASKLANRVSAWITVSFSAADGLNIAVSVGVFLVESALPLCRGVLLCLDTSFLPPHVILMSVLHHLH